MHVQAGFKASVRIRGSARKPGDRHSFGKTGLNVASVQLLAIIVFADELKSRRIADELCAVVGWSRGRIERTGVDDLRLRKLIVV